MCVRIVQAWGMDLTVFQFDYNLTWAVFFMNADKTIYGRYGTHAAQDTMKDISMEGFKEAARAALELHKGFPGNKKSLAAKTGPAPKWKTPEMIPTLAGKHKQGDLSRWGCVHCHMIVESELTSFFMSKQPVSDSLIWRHPMPDVLGFNLDTKQRATVASVANGSAAEKAGLQVGDKVLSLDGQPIISIADVQWVLFNAKDSGQLKGQVDRAGKTVSVDLTLAAGWRRKQDFTVHESAWMLEMSLFGCGMKSEPSGIKIAHIANGAKDSPAATKAGLQVGDVIVAVDGKNIAGGRSEFLAYVFQKKAPGQPLALSIQRGGKTITINLTPEVR